MKYLKIMGPLALAAAALMVFAGSASATTLRGPNGESTPTFHMVHEGTHVILNNPVAKLECNMTYEASITTHGTGITSGGPMSTLTMTNCTNSWHFTTVAPGRLEVHYVSSGVGTLTWSGTTISSTRFGVICNYATNNTHIGTVTDSSITGGGATVHINAQIPIHSGSSAFCGTGSTKWTGNFVTTQKLFIDP
jgi:hypothetical protein